jgi:hypothetical protein
MVVHEDDAFHGFGALRSAGTLHVTWVPPCGLELKLTVPPII